MTLRDELIQVAAVAVAIVEDMDTGAASRDGLAQVMADVGEERMRQQRKWGDQHHDDPIIWLAILAEEVGEAALELDGIDAIEAVGWHASYLIATLARGEEFARAILTKIGNEP
jgi:hypothetical protein